MEAAGLSQGEIVAKKGEHIPPNRYRPEIIKKLEAVVRRSGSRQDQVFYDWVRLCEASLDALPKHFAAAVQGQVYEDDEPTQKLWAEMRTRYEREQFNTFAEAMGLLTLVPENMGYIDMLGDIYMEWGYPSKGKGQYFTPIQIARLMAGLVGDTDDIQADIKQRLRAAWDKSEIAQAIGLAGLMLDRPETPPEVRDAYFIARIWPELFPHFEPVKVYDPAIGSGVLILAAAEAMPWWATQLGMVQFYGSDIDFLCVSMVRTNFCLYGLNGHYAGPIVYHYEGLLQAYFRGDYPPGVVVAPDHQPTAAAFTPPKPKRGKNGASQPTLFEFMREGA